MGNTFIAVEGQHDVEFKAGLLEAEGFQKVVLVEQFDERFCQRLINTSFPHEGDLHKRVPNPMFLKRGDDWIAVQAAGGGTVELIALARKALNALRPFPGVLSSLAIIRDTNGSTPDQMFAELISAASSLQQIENYTINLPARQGEIVAGNPRFGTYLLPDNINPGTLEDLLIACGEVVYPELLNGARHFVDSLDLTKLDAKDRSLINKPSGKKKAVLACAANILKPGMSIATSIDQNRWLNDETRELPRVKALAEFLKNLCGIT